MPIKYKNKSKKRSKKSPSKATLLSKSEGEAFKRKSKKRNIKSPRRCDGDVCCQVITHHGVQCTRKAKIKFDMTKGTKIMGYSVIPKFNCCFFCVQHAAIITGYATYEIGMFLATKDLSHDEYLALNPEYLDIQMKMLSL